MTSLSYLETGSSTAPTGANSSISFTLLPYVQKYLVHFTALARVQPGPGTSFSGTTNATTASTATKIYLSAAIAASNVGGILSVTALGQAAIKSVGSDSGGPFVTLAGTGLTSAPSTSTGYTVAGMPRLYFSLLDGSGNAVGGLAIVTESTAYTRVTHDVQIDLTVLLFPPRPA